jgi:hypothetical protein
VVDPCVLVVVDVPRQHPTLKVGDGEEWVLLEGIDPRELDALLGRLGQLEALLVEHVRNAFINVLLLLFFVLRAVRLVAVRAQVVRRSTLLGGVQTDEVRDVGNGHEAS